MPLVNKSFSDIITFTRSTGGGRFNAQGNYEWLPANTPRIDYDPVTGECRGLLIEEQRTNLLSWSNDFTQGVWRKVGASIAPVSAMSPAGEASVSLVAEDAASGTHVLNRINVAAQTTASVWAFSIYAKPAGRRYIMLETSGVKRVIFDLEAKQVTHSGSGASGSVEDAGGGWVRCTIIATPGTTSSLYVELKLSTGPTVAETSYQGDGTSGIYIWGAQLEAGAFPTSLIHTTDAQVTRAADIASVNELSPWYRADEGTLVVEAVPAAVGALHIFSLSDGTSTNYMQALAGSGASGQRTFEVRTEGAFQAAIGAGSYVAGEANKVAASYRADDVAVSLNGAAAVIDTSASIPAVTRLNIGANSIGLGQFNGHIRSLRFYPRAMPDQLQALTA